MDALVAEYQREEGHSRRGPRFAAVAYEIERRMRHEIISPRQLIEWFGEPAQRVGDDASGTLVYLFDHTEPDLCRDEWYFLIDGGRVTNSGFNRRGVNSWPG
jgi:hypothetical protein